MTERQREMNIGDKVKIEATIVDYNEGAKTVKNKNRRLTGRWLYDPETDSRNRKEFTYNLPIHENDTLFNGFSYREIMDVVIANYGHNITEKQFDKALKEFMDIRIEDMKENLMMCKANMLKEIRKVGRLV